MKKIKIIENNNDRVFVTLNYIFLTIAGLIVLYPLIYIFSSSFSSSKAVMGGKVWLLPIEPTLRGYKAVFAFKSIWIGYANSIYYAVVGTIINLVVTMLAAFPLARRDLVGRKFIIGLFVFTMLFNAGLIPTYIVISNLGLVNSRWVLWLPQALQVWYLIIAITYLQSNIPKELREASSIDGCSNIKFLTRIVLPLAKPLLAVLVLFYAVYHWNAFFDAFIYLKEKRLYPLQLMLREILISSQIDPLMLKNIGEMEKLQGLMELLKYAVIVVASLPVLALYPFVQKYFIKGIMVGSLKG